MAYAQSFEKFFAKVAVNNELQVRLITLDFFGRVVQRTPVDTGRARGNWAVNVGPSPSGGGDTIFNGGGAASGNPSQGTLDFVVSQIPEKITDKPGYIWMANNLPYIRKLEEGGYPSPPKKPTGKTQGGYSIQAPNGMVRITALEFGSIADEARSKVTT